MADMQYRYKYVQVQRIVKGDDVRYLVQFCGVNAWIDIRRDVASQVLKALEDSLPYPMLVEKLTKVWATLPLGWGDRTVRGLRMGSAVVDKNISQHFDPAAGTTRGHRNYAAETPQMSIIAILDAIPIELPTVEMHVPSAEGREFRHICNGKRHAMRLSADMSLTLVHHPTEADEVRAEAEASLNGKVCKCLEAKWSWEAARRGLYYNSCVPNGLAAMRRVVFDTAEFTKGA